MFRMANFRRVEDFIDDLELDRQSRDEIRELLSASGYSLHLDELLDGPFRLKRRLQRQTRFSDGSFPVFYSSLDPTTAEAEIGHWFPRYCGSPQSPRTAYYQQFSCIFAGTEKDLRPKIKHWPELVHDSDYSLCNRVGSEARRLELDGLVTWSARHQGANVPVFERPAVSNPRLEGMLAMTYDPNTDKVTAENIEEKNADWQAAQ